MRHFSVLIELRGDNYMIFLVTFLTLYMLSCASYYMKNPGKCIEDISVSVVGSYMKNAMCENILLVFVL